MSKAFVYQINPIGSSQDEQNQTHQSSPHWVLTFVRWADRDTLRTKPTGNVTWSTTRGDIPLVVENDCIQVAVNMNKGILTPSMNATLIQTDVNYMTDVAPGDFVIVNMLNWSKDARRVADNARANKPINGLHDGFKGVFKVQSVRKTLQVDPNTGTRMLVFKVNGFAFTEFNNTIYFQPEMLNETEKTNVGLYASNLGSNWSLIVSDKALTNSQDIITALVQSLLGSGISDNGIADKLGNLKTFNTLFFIPPSLGNLLGVKGAKAAKDVYNFLFGIQQYSGGATQDLTTGFNPSNLSDEADTIEGRFYNTSSKCKGNSIQKPEYWNQVKVWAILNQFTNSPLNEMFTTFRVSPSGTVMPTVVYRQIPFTNEDFKAGNAEVTRFLSLPRWKIHNSLILSMDIGRDEAARINFVQYFGRAGLTSTGWGVSEETAQKNYLYDIDDVKRSGLRPYVISSAFDITDDKQNYSTPVWARIVGDALIGGHLKLNGNFECAGIVEPIAVGDNFEHDGTVFHIEEVSHSASIAPTGQRMFRTKVSVSSGINKNSSVKGTRYAEMTFSDADSMLNADWKGNQILPGIAESQDVVYRPNNLDQPVSKGSPFIQPDSGANASNPVRDNGGEKDRK